MKILLHCITLLSLVALSAFGQSSVTLSQRATDVLPNGKATGEPVMATFSRALLDSDGKVVLQASGAALICEGSTRDQFETTISITDPTADRTITLPDASGTPILSTAAQGAAGGIWAGATSLVFEGATADAYETTLTVTDPTADRTVTVPNATGTVTLAQASTTVSLTADDQAVTPGTAARIQLSSDNGTAANRTFTLSATGAITGQIYVLIGPATNQCEIAATGIQKLSATWSPTTSDTLTLLFDGTNYLELARSNN